MMNETTTSAVYKVPECNLEDLGHRITKLNKRAAKLHLEPIVLTVVKIEDVEQKPKNKLDPITYRRYHHITFTGVTPKLAGWALQGVLEQVPEIEGNIIRAVPGISLPVVYRTAPAVCDHCKTIRRRTETFVLLHESGEYKQVGRNCIVDFLGGQDPANLLAVAEYLSSIEACLSDAEDCGGYGAREREYISLLEVLRVAALFVRVEGWTSRKVAQERGMNATATLVQNWLFSRDREKDFGDLTRYAELPEDMTCAEDAIAWARSLTGDLNDYEYNLSVVGKLDLINQKAFGLAVSLISAHRRAIGKAEELRKQKEVAVNSEYFGTVGKREEFVLRVLNVIPLSSHYGPLELNKMIDPQGNIAVWFSSRGHLDVGSTYRIKATVKAHELYNGSKQTTLTRGKVVESTPS